MFVIQKDVILPKVSTEQKNPPLIRAIQEGDYETFSALLQTEDVNERGINNTTPLLEAVYFSHFPTQRRMFFELLNHPKIDVNLADDTGVTPLGVAVVYMPHFVKRLLKCGANPDNYTYVRLNGGIDPEGKNYNRWRQLTPLAVAVRNRNKKLALLLLRYHADINKVGDLDISPLSLSGRSDDVTSMKFLVEKGARIEELPTNWQEYTSSPADCCSVVLRKVLKYGAFNCLTYLIQQGIKIPKIIHRKEGAYATPLTYLLSQPVMTTDIQRYESCAYALLKLGTQTDIVEKSAYQALDRAATDSKGRNALYYAVRSSYGYDLLKLLATPQTVNQRDYKGETPFTLAVYKRDMTSTLLLLEWGANPNEEIWYYPSSIRTLTSHCVKEPIIFYALRKKNIELAKLLVLRGAHLLYTNKEGKTPADYVTPDMPLNFRKLFVHALHYQQKIIGNSSEVTRLQRMAKAYFRQKYENTIVPDR